MIPTKNFRRTASSLILLSILFGITLTYATTENDYTTDNNFLTDISETTLTENGYKTNIIINPDTTGAYATENGYKLDLTINTAGIGGKLTENNYQLNLIPEKSFPEMSDVAVTRIVVSKTVVGQGYSLLINVTVLNQALTYETFSVIIKANTTTVKTQAITLTSGSSTTITFTWNTTDVAYGNYTMSAVAETVLGETDASDNTYTNGIVIVTVPGDASGDGFVDVTDFAMLGKSWFKGCLDPDYDPRVDYNNDNFIDVTDFAILGRHWFQHT